MSKNYAFPQMFPRGLYKTVPLNPIPPMVELSPKLLGELAQLCRVESAYARDVTEYTYLQWIKADLERRWRRAVKP